jgi:subtilisin family serine protease
MKPHIIIKLRKPLDEYTPNWLDNIKQKVQQRFPPKFISNLLLKYNIPAVIFKEYRSSKNNWSKEESEVGLNRIYRLILKSNKRIPDELIDEIRLLPEIEFASTAKIGSTSIPINEFSHQTALSSKYRKNGIYLEEAHWFTQGNNDIKIAVLDTGFELDHPEFKKNMNQGMDFVNIINGETKFIGDFLEVDDDPSDKYVGHGTHVAGIIVAEGKKMPIGIAPKCRLIPVRVLGALKKEGKLVGAGLIDNINSGIKYAVDSGASIINMSLGVKHEEGGLPHKEVIEYALKKGVSVVAASGNDGTEEKYYPGALPGVIAVGAALEGNQVASFSTYGNHVSFVAPGKNIYSSFINHSYAISSGTSQAAPFVSGAIALIKSFALDLGKKISDSQVKHLLKHTATRPDRHYKDNHSGFGMINILDALKLLKYNLNIS